MKKKNRTTGKKKDAFSIIRRIIDVIVIISFIAADAWTESKLGDIAGWIFFILGFMPIESFLDGYDGGALAKNAGEEAIAFHLTSLLIAAKIVNNPANLCGLYLVLVFVAMEIRLKHYHSKKHEEYKSRYEALKAKRKAK